MSTATRLPRLATRSIPLREGGAFTRVDGRSATAFSVDLGTPTAGDRDNTVTFNYELCTFESEGKPAGSISEPSTAQVQGNGMSGTFTVTGVDMNGNPLPGFPKSGTFDATVTLPIAEQRALTTESTHPEQEI